jgi:hypothetical protein
MDVVEASYSEGFCLRRRRCGNSYPFTLTRENDSIARPVVGLPMESAGRNVVNVVKMSMSFLTRGNNELSSLESERMR